VFVESLYSRIRAAALQQHVVAVSGPRLRQRGSDDGGAVTKAAEIGMRDHVLQEAVAPALTKQIRRGDQHARRRDPYTFFGHENVDPRPFERLEPQPFRAFEGLDDGAHLRRGKQIEQRGQVGGTGKARSHHSEKVRHPSQATNMPDVMLADLELERANGDSWMARRKALDVPRVTARDERQLEFECGGETKASTA
jgi:hypothetical protein